MTSTTAAAATLTEGEHLAHRPRGVVHLYRGPLTASGRYAKRGPACGQRTNRLQILEPPTSPLDPSWTRRLCLRCEPLLATPPAPVTREDWQPWDSITPAMLVIYLQMAETVAEVDRVAFLALRVVGVTAATAPLPGRDSTASLLQRVATRRAQLDEAAAERHRDEAARSRQITARARAGDAQDLALKAEHRAARTHNPVDRLRATRHRQYADAETARARAS